MQTIHEQACGTLLKAEERVSTAIRELTIEFKSSAEHGAELNQAQRQINTLKYNQQQLQDKVNALKKDKEDSKQEVEKAKKNNESLKQKTLKMSVSKRV
ncbi:hypothetical protein FNE76_07720 [Helicobacter mehlei]|uniref:Uncharacterized protein n=1 Tax=Helicobacter mehlei TaxID=2316080 RepID=A0A553UIE2_9HELI|nr:hypothetical protein [Helicobacter mehlei]TSA79952.1 hypothetical protein FNE76_07720 [Helicobacter mehlei]